MARLQYCREHLTDEVIAACNLSNSTVAEVRQAAKFCDEHSDFSELPTKPIIALIRVRDEQVRERAIIKCSERLNGKIGAGRGNTKELTEKMVKKVIEDTEIEVRNEGIARELAEEAAEEARTGIKHITQEEVEEILGRDNEPADALTNNTVTEIEIENYFELMAKILCQEDIPKHTKRIEMMIKNKTLRVV